MPFCGWAGKVTEKKWFRPPKIPSFYLLPPKMLSMYRKIHKNPVIILTFVPKIK